MQERRGRDDHVISNALPWWPSLQAEYLALSGVVSYAICLMFPMSQPISLLAPGTSELVPVTGISFLLFSLSGMFSLCVCTCLSSSKSPHTCHSLEVFLPDHPAKMPSPPALCLSRQPLRVFHSAYYNSSSFYCLHGLACLVTVLYTSVSFLAWTVVL